MHNYKTLLNIYRLYTYILHEKYTFCDMSKKEEKTMTFPSCAFSSSFYLFLHTRHRTTPHRQEAAVLYQHKACKISQTILNCTFKTTQQKLIVKSHGFNLYSVEPSEKYFKAVDAVLAFQQNRIELNSWMFPPWGDPFVQKLVSVVQKLNRD